MTESNLTNSRAKIKNLVNQYLEKNQPTGWFEELYAQANYNPQQIPWANLTPNSYLIQWLKTNSIINNKAENSLTAIVIGCGLGDDAEALQNAGFQVTAFDVSSTAINWCQQRFPNSSVNYVNADIFNLPSNWQKNFDLVWECRTIQSLPLDVRKNVINQVASLVKPTGKLLLVTHFRGKDEKIEGPPWALSAEELSNFQQLGLKKLNSLTNFNNEKQVTTIFLEYS